MSGQANVDAVLAPDRHAAEKIAYPRPVIAWWSVIVFFLLYNLSFLDRTMLNLLVVPIRASLGVTDFQVSLLQGFAFAIFYTAFGIPIGWAVDHGPRRRIICFGIILWSLAASACGLASRYWHLALGRVGVAVGEASLAPAAYSLLSDIFPPEKLALPMSVMGAGAALGSAIAAIAAGLIVDAVPVQGMNVPLLGNLVGWQVALVATGVPGLLLAPLVYSIPEPGRSAPSPRQQDKGSFAHVLVHLRAHKTFYIGHFLGFGLFSMVNYGLTSWLAAYFMRVHGWPLKEVAFLSGGIVLCAGLPGTIAMGYIVDRWYAAGRRDAHLVFFAICAFVQLACIAVGVLSGSSLVAVIFFSLSTLMTGFTGVGAAALQIATPVRMRGQISAIYLLVFNLIGLGCGPSVVALFTDFLFHDDMQVGSAILLTYAIFSPIAAALLLIAARAIRRAGKDGRPHHLAQG